MKSVLIIGGGGRESALAYRLNRENIKIYAIPGNPGIFEYGIKASCNLNEFQSISDFVFSQNIDLVVIGPEKFLADGLVDYLRDKGINVFGPTKKAAQIETDKSFAKTIMQKYNIPTAEFEIFYNQHELINFINTKDYPYVLKVSGLAAGKGAFVIHNKMEKDHALNEIFKENKFKHAADKIVFEEFMEGEEASLFVITDGINIIPLLPAQDYKRAFDNDRGLNTGGMGSYAPFINMNNKLQQDIIEKIINPILYGLKEENALFTGLLYTGLMIKDNNARVVEFNARFGDPETQSIITLLEDKTSLFEILMQSAQGVLKEKNIEFEKQYAVTVVIAANEYPQTYEKNIPVLIDYNNMDDDVYIYHAGTKMDNSILMSNGGRIINITAKDNTLEKTVKKVYKNINNINIENSFYRKDIAKRALI